MKLIAPPADCQVTLDEAAIDQLAVLVIPDGAGRGPTGPKPGTAG